MTTIVERARAKVNLTLRVLGRRSDGYHEIESLVAFADVADRMEFSPGRRAGVDVSGPFADGIVGRNLIERALDAAARAEPNLRLGRVALVKMLPVASGIGGGSADAAAVLRAVRRANPECSERVDWHGVAASLGADVPVCLADRAALVRGTGTAVTPVRAFAPLAAVLVNPRVPVPSDKTAQVFARLVTAGTPPQTAGSAADAPVEDIAAYMNRNGNDLTRPALEIVPVAADVFAALEATAGCRLARLSGAGPTAFGLFANDDAARAAAAVLRARHPDWWIVATSIS